MDRIGRRPDEEKILSSLVKSSNENGLAGFNRVSWKASLDGF